MYKALYRTERPETFDEVIGQDHIVRVLKNQIKNDTLGHAYLFCGTRGTGKTTMARLLAKAVNCTSDGERPCGQCENCQSIKEGSFIDMIEIDAASNNGVESVRELRDSVNYPASMGRRKVYIIDEVHMLSTAAFNALLKTLEEPPEGIMFILATTDPQKLPQTILSRCMRFNFRRVSEKQIAAQMSGICRKRGIKITDDALHLLAANADGSVRDGLSLLDQCLAGSGDVLDRNMVLEYLGAVSENFFIELTEKVQVCDTAGALLLLEEVLQEGKDVKQLLNGWMGHYRSLLIAKYIRDPEALLNMSAENIEILKTQSQGMDLSTINNAIIRLAKTINDARYSTQVRTLMELAIVMLAGGMSADMAAGENVRMGGAVSKIEAGVKIQPLKRSTKQIKKERAPWEANEKKPLDEGTAERTSGVIPWEDETPAAHTEPVKAVPNSEVHTQEAAPDKAHACGGRVQERAVDKAGVSENFAVERGSQASNRDREVADEEVVNGDGAENFRLDLDELWERVWDKLPDNGSISMVRMNSNLAGINDREFKVLVGNDFVREIAEKNSGLIASAMEDETGKKLKMVLRAAGDETESNSGGKSSGEGCREKEDKAQRIADEIAAKFNIKPRIE